MQVLIDNPLLGACVFGMVCTIIPSGLAFAAGRWSARNRIIIEAKDDKEIQ